MDHSGPALCPCSPPTTVKNPQPHLPSFLVAAQIQCPWVEVSEFHTVFHLLFACVCDAEAMESILFICLWPGVRLLMAGPSARGPAQTWAYRPGTGKGIMSSGFWEAGRGEARGMALRAGKEVTCCLHRL